eukprot:5651707-Prymnesium_polylepis.1
MHVPRPTACTADRACGAEAGPPPSCGPAMALTRPCAAKCALRSRASTEASSRMGGSLGCAPRPWPAT